MSEMKARLTALEDFARIEGLDVDAVLGVGYEARFLDALSQAQIHPCESTLDQAELRHMELAAWWEGK